MACTPLLHLGGRLKSLEKSLLAGGGGAKIFISVGGGEFYWGGALNFKLKLKIYNTSIKSIFGIT